jgi:hypothetical protein
LYLDILLIVDCNGRLTTILYDKRNDFNFAIVNFPFPFSNIPLSSPHDVHQFELIMQEHILRLRLGLFKTRQATYKNVDVAGL